MTQNCKYNLLAKHNHLFWKYRLKFQSIPGDFDLRPLKCPWLPGADKKPRCSYSLDMFGKYWTVLIAHRDRQISPHRSKTAASWSHRHLWHCHRGLWFPFQPWERPLEASRCSRNHRWVHSTIPTAPSDAWRHRHQRQPQWWREPCRRRKVRDHSDLI